MLGVALAFSVHLINASALAEFAAAVRSVNGEPDLELRAAQGGFDEALYARVAAHAAGGARQPGARGRDLRARRPTGKRVPLRVLGIDALVVGRVAPALLPRPTRRADRLALLDPTRCSSTPPPRSGSASRRRQRCACRPALAASSCASPAASARRRRAAGGDGHRRRAGPASARCGQLVAHRRAAGARRRPRRSARAQLALPAGVRAAGAGRCRRSASRTSRAPTASTSPCWRWWRCSPAPSWCSRCCRCRWRKRAQQFALLGVLGLTAAPAAARWCWPNRRCSALVGSVARPRARHRAGGARAAAAGRRPGRRLLPRRRADAALRARPAALVYGALGVAAALVGGWLPARAAQRAGAGAGAQGPGRRAPRAGRRRAARPAADRGRRGCWRCCRRSRGLPLAAYLSVALLLVGGIACVPAGVGAAARRLRRAPRSALPLLARRARAPHARQRRPWRSAAWSRA